MPCEIKSNHLAWWGAMYSDYGHAPSYHVGVKKTMVLLSLVAFLPQGAFTSL